MKRQPKSAAERRRSSIGTASEIDCLSAETTNIIDKEIDRRFSDSARIWLTDGRWTRHVTAKQADWRRPFACAYSYLLSRAVEDHADLLTQAILASPKRHMPYHWLQIAGVSVRHVEKFLEKDCVDGWLAHFLQHHQQMQDALEVPEWYSGTTTIIDTAHLAEVPGIDWKRDALERTKNRIVLRVMTTASSATNSPILDFERVAKIRSFTYAQAATMFERDSHTIQRWIREGKFARAGRGRVKNDSRFMAALNEFHGIPQSNE